MRIVGGQRDYYDHMQGTDQDRETLFVRKRVEHEDVSLKGIPEMSERDCIVGVAGKLYHYTEVDRGWFRGSPRPPLVQWWHGEWELRSTTVYDREREAHRRKLLNAPRLDLFDRFGHIFCIKRSGYNLADMRLRYCVTSYPSLERLGFDAVMKPHEIYEVLTRAVYNSARPARPIPEMDNKTKIELAGFDLKTSFRKEPGKRRRA